MTREVCVVIFDAGPSLSARLDRFSRAKRAATRFLQQKMVSAETYNEYAWVCIGSNVTNNALIGASGDGSPRDDSPEASYRHINVVSGLAKPTAEFVRLAADSMEPDGQPADLVEGLIVASKLLSDKGTIRKGLSKNIFVFTDFGQDTAYGDAIEQFRSKMDEWEVSLSCCMVDHPDDIGRATSAVSQPPVDDLEQRQQRMLGMGAVLFSNIHSLNRLMQQQLRFLQPPAVVPPTARILFSIGSHLRIPMQRYLKTTDPKVPKPALYRLETAPGHSSRGNLEPLSRAVTLQDSAAMGGTAPAVPRDAVIQAYRLGPHLIPLEEIYKAAVKMDTVAGMTLVCFTQRSAVPSSHFLSTAKTIVPQLGNADAARATSALVRAMLATDQIAIVRYVYRNGSDPVLAALRPHEKESYACFDFFEVPYADDIRVYRFRTFNDVPVERAQIKAAENLIVALQLPNYSADGSLQEPSIDGKEGAEADVVRHELLHPKSNRDPDVQYLFETLHARLLEPHAPLPEIPRHIQEAAFPERYSAVYRMFKASEKEIRAFQERFPLFQQQQQQEEAANATAGGKESKRSVPYWYDEEGDRGEEDAGTALSTKRKKA